jgi:hypothetical protein
MEHFPARLWVSLCTGMTHSGEQRPTGAVTRVTFSNRFTLKSTAAATGEGRFGQAGFWSDGYWAGEWDSILASWRRSKILSCQHDLAWS